VTNDASMHVDRTSRYGKHAQVHAQPIQVNLITRRLHSNVQTYLPTVCQCSSQRRLRTKRISVATGHRNASPAVLSVGLLRLSLINDFLLHIARTVKYDELNRLAQSASRCCKLGLPARRSAALGMRAFKRLNDNHRLNV